MTEAEWQSSDAVGLMLDEFVPRLWQAAPGKGRRQLRLFGCAYLRAYWFAMCHDDTREAAAVAERLADGDASDGEATEAYNRAWRVVEMLREGDSTPLHRKVADAASRLVYPSFDAGGWWKWSRAHPEDDPCPPWAYLLREILGNIFAPRALDPAWQTADTRALATTAYTARELPSGHLNNAHLAVLSDALEEAGCTDAAILSHLRSEGPHVRGCWALDLVLGKG